LIAALAPAKAMVPHQGQQLADHNLENVLAPGGISPEV
jgi:hypothetical protein